MKALLIYSCAITILLSCNNSKKLQYNFDSPGVVDSVTLTLKKFEKNYGKDFSQVKWFALIRQNDSGFAIIINENTDKTSFPFKKLLKKTNRFLKIGNQLYMPVIFDIDFLNEDFKKITKGIINFGGYYFQINKINEEYKVVDISVLF